MSAAGQRLRRENEAARDHVSTPQGPGCDPAVLKGQYGISRSRPEVPRTKENAPDIWHQYILFLRLMPTYSSTLQISRVAHFLSKLALAIMFHQLTWGENI